MTKILAPLSSDVTFLHPKDFKNTMDAEAISRTAQRTEYLVSSLAHPLVWRDAFSFYGRTIHEVHVHVSAGALCTLACTYHAHEKDADLAVRYFVTLEKDSTFSLDIASFLLGERSKSDVRVFLVLNEGSRATVRQLTRAEGSSSVVHEEIRGLAIGEYAHASFIPELELLHDDVLATHAASIVRVHEKRIAYLLARGVSREDAVQCLADAFLTNTSLPQPEGDSPGRSLLASG